MSPSSPSFDGGTPVAKFYRSWFQGRHHDQAAEKTRKNYRIAIGYLEAHLDRQATLADLTADNLVAVLDWLEDKGRTAYTRQQARQILLRIATEAVNVGALGQVPEVPEVFIDVGTLRPWSLAELNRLMASARHAEGNVGQVPARLWWPALFLTVLDTGQTAAAIFEMAPRHFERNTGLLAVGQTVHCLHAKTIEAINRMIDRQAPRLLVWPKDNGRPSTMLFREFKQLLYRAGLSPVRDNLFTRLRVTADQPGILDQVNLAMPFIPVEGSVKFPRASQREHWQENAWRSRGSARADAPPNPDCEIVPIRIESERTLGSFFETTYLPMRLADGSEATVASYRSTLRRLRDFAACDVTVDALCDDFLWRYLMWLRESGRTNGTANRHRAEILALWRYARKKRWIAEEPLDVDKLKEMKRIPKAWTVQQLGALLKAAAETPGQVSGIPAGQWWAGLILFLYDSGLRIAAALSARIEDLDLEAGHILIRAETQKQKADQVFSLHPDTLAIIAATKPAERDLVFPWPYSVHHNPLRKAFREILQRAGLPHGKRDLFHKVRRSSATHLANATNEQEAFRHLGHSDPSVTKRYLDPTQIVNRVQASKVLPRPDWKGTD